MLYMYICMYVQVYIYVCIGTHGGLRITLNAIFWDAIHPLREKVSIGLELIV